MGSREHDYEECSIFLWFFLGLTVTWILVSMEFCRFAIYTVLAFIPWILAEEKLLYQTPNENSWGGWQATSNGTGPVNVIKLVYPDYKHPICQRVAFTWPLGCIIVDLTSLPKDTPVRQAPFSKYNGLFKWYFNLCPYSRVILYLFWTSNLFACTALYHTAVFRQSPIVVPYLSITAFFF